MKRVFVSGISTGVGKTVIASALVQLWGAQYWKPVQSGTETEGEFWNDSNSTDSKVVFHLTGAEIVPEGYALKAPLSPHAAAELESVVILPETLMLPSNGKPLVVEGAGGLLVPLNEEDLLIDLIVKFQLPAVLVSRHYLGSINHTLLSLEALRSRGIPLYGIVFVGEENLATERVIISRAGVRHARIPIFDRIDQSAISFIAHELEGAGF